MKKAKEILEMIEGRLSSPLIFSFLISWMVINWQIVLVLLFGLDAAPKETDAKGNALYSTLIEYISYHFSIWKSILYPFLGAVGYTFLNPVVQRYVSNFYADQQQKGNAKNMEIAKEQGLIKGEKYLEVKTKLFEQLEKVQKITEEDAEKDKRIVDLESKQRNHDDELENERNEVKRYSDLYQREKKHLQVGNFNGKWKVSYKFNDEEITEIQIFENGNYSIETQIGHDKDQGSIIHYYTNFERSSVFFVKVQSESTMRVRQESGTYFDHKAVTVYLTRDLENENLYKGLENNILQVTYERLYKTPG